MNELFSAAGPPGAKEKIASCCKAPSEGKTLRAGKSNTWTAVAFGLLHLDDESAHTCLVGITELLFPAILSDKPLLPCTYPTTFPEPSS